MILVNYKIASTTEEFENAKKLFQEYFESLKIDLTFQNVEQELKELDIQYNKPTGAIILAIVGAEPIACVAIRKLTNETAELKRMYVKVEFRNNKIGASLLTQIIEVAKSFGYKKIRLDTLPTMAAAYKIYRDFGFYEIDSYIYNPIRDTRFMEKII